jgi:hypothetical protein
MPWKYRHAAKLHADALAIIITYNLCRDYAPDQCATQAFGVRNDDEHVVLDIHTFRDCLGSPGLKYLVVNLGDSFMQAAVKIPKNKCPALVVNND